MTCSTLALLVSLGSLHVNAPQGINNINPGLIASCDHLEAGAYYNSQRRVSFYAGYVNDWLRAGWVTGYSLAPVLPQVALHHAVGWFDVNAMAVPRLDGDHHVQGLEGVLSLSLEWRIR